jgi:MFS family permease
MDRLGTRRVALFFVWTAMALAPVFPLLPWFWPLLLLQVVNGGALQFAWSGSQTLIAQLAEGEAEYLGRFSFFARIGTTVAPMIAGAAWDFGGAWPAYALGLAWGVALTLALLRAPEAGQQAAIPLSFSSEQGLAAGADQRRGEEGAEGDRGAHRITAPSAGIRGRRCRCRAPSFPPPRRPR